MPVLLNELQAFLDGPETVLVRVQEVKGSTPRERGAWMLVAEGDLLGTIGGGQLEFIAIDKARQMLRSAAKRDELEVPLGPETGQCCGGRVSLVLERMTPELAVSLLKMRRGEIENQRDVYIMGAGHVGRALARAMAPLPFNVIIVDTRAAELLGLPDDIETRLSAVPEAEVRGARSGSAFVVLTHDHALDFLIAREALLRGDAAYVGMIGSKTKRAVFGNWMEQETGSEELLEALICPIGGENRGDKRPEVIAALVAAEILVQTGKSPLPGMRGKTGPECRGTGRVLGDV